MKPALIIDAGANIGLSALYFRMKFHDAKIICFEPETNNFEILRKNILQHNNIELVQKGLWSESTDIYLNSGTSAYDFYITDAPTEATIGKIPCISIPDLIKQYGIVRIDILKLDIEGAEKQILASNTEWLDKVECLMIETHDRMVKGTGKALFDAMNDYEFDLEVQDETLKFFNITRK
jgi:FkbM family methyltransferase